MTGGVSVTGAENVWGSGTPLTLEDVDQIGANNLLATLFLRMIKDLENALDFSFVIWSLGRSLP